jgi:hypothetical protein
LAQHRWERRRAVPRATEIAIDGFLPFESVELGRKPFEVESPLRLQAAHLTHRLSFTSYLTEQSAGRQLREEAAAGHTTLQEAAEGHTTLLIIQPTKSLISPYTLCGGKKEAADLEHA